MCRIDLFYVSLVSELCFLKNSVRFEKNAVRLLQLFTTYLSSEWLIYSKYYSITAMMNKLCTPDFDTVIRYSKI